MLPLVLTPLKLNVGVAGGGEALARRAALLAEAGVQARLLSPDASDEVLAPLHLLFIAGLPEGEARHLAARARGLGSLVNVEDVLALCDFHVPAIVRQGDLLLTVSTGGTAPGVARLFRDRLAESFGPEWSERLADLGSQRARFRGQGLTPADVSKKLRDLVAPEELAVTATVIDAHKNLMPRQSAVPKAALARLQERAASLDAHGIVELALTGEFQGHVAVVSSFGAESAVLLHLVASVAPLTPVLFLNTGKLFGETLRYKDRLQDVLGLGDVRNLSPVLEARRAHDPDGSLWSRDTAACCGFRKVPPLAHALQPFAAQITGRKRFQTRERSMMQPVEWFGGRFRFNPLWQWTQNDLAAYAAAHELPAHPLVADGYPSIGCIPCTRRVAPGESYRAGRWAGLDKDECGIHTGTDGDGI